MPDVCSQAVLDQLSASAGAGAQAALAPDPTSVDLECSPVFEWDEQFDQLVIAGLCARDYFQYGPVAVQLDREVYAPPASFDVCMPAWGHPTYARQRLQSIRPAALQAVLVLESWFDAVLDAFPYSLWYEISENSECTPMVSQIREQVGRGCSLHYIGRRDGTGCVYAHSMPPICNVAADNRIEVWLHAMTIWHQLARRLRRCALRR